MAAALLEEGDRAAVGRGGWDRRSAALSRDGLATPRACRDGSPSVQGQVPLKGLPHTGGEERSRAVAARPGGGDGVGPQGPDPRKQAGQKDPAVLVKLDGSEAAAVG